MAMKSHKIKLIAFDFDGVICNSAPEMGRSCLDVAFEFQQAKQEFTVAEQEKFRSFFNSIRPYLEVGYQGVLVALWFTQQNLRTTLPLPSENASAKEWEEFLKILAIHVAELFPEKTRNTSHYPAILTEKLGERRDELLNSDPSQWNKLNPLYAGMPELLLELLANDQNVVAIVSTKQERFIHAILEHARLPIKRALIFGLEGGLKEIVLKNLLTSYSPSQAYFIEDRVETLRRITLDRQLCAWKLLFATWGYATPEQHLLVKKTPRITAVTSLSFATLLKHS